MKRQEARLSRLRVSSFVEGSLYFSGYATFRALSACSGQGGDFGIMTTLRSDEFMNRALRDWEDLVYRLALGQTQSPADASDVCQEVFISLLKDSTLFQDDEHLKAWLIRVTINRCRQLHRTMTRHRTQPLPDDDALLPTAPAAPAALQSSDVWRLLQGLSQKHRAVMNLHYVEGYSTEEIAEIMKCRPATVRSRLHRARAQLKTLFEQEESHEELADRRIPCFDGGSKEPECGA